MHELSHYFACIMLGVKVKGFSLGLKESYVKHENASTIKIVLIAIAPLIIGLLLSIALIKFTIMDLRRELLLFIIVNWLIISIVYYSIPSSQDTKNIKTSLGNYLTKLFKGNILDKMWGAVYFIIVIIPNYFLLELISLLDKYEIFRIILLAVMYICLV